MTNQEVIALGLTLVNVIYGIGVVSFLEIWDEQDTIKRAIVGLTAMIPFFALSYFLLNYCEVI
ncbi:hypothetical protein phiAS5_ORF0204 [Aeromonas phage phiAS5]|uniref:Uncharacterized protein n=1 Tax=Aeromonas phage phiAS5 TaxID=879630 RepID=E1A2V1_9CAUD|nr:hypothetical protein phiAS5_ORF0204 [Aeromonas phage phiAS5]ADM80047.1 hypothetical protein phiAS5_ORF0204 [Aeromonas phage phiAS5]BES53185.1 hypothetical protein [Aeromonas phage phiWae14]